MTPRPRFLPPSKMAASWDRTVLPRIHRAMTDGTVPSDGLPRASFIERVLFDVPLGLGPRTTDWLAKRGILRLARDGERVRVLPPTERGMGRPIKGEVGFRPVLSKEQHALLVGLLPLVCWLNETRAPKATLAAKAAALEDERAALVAISKRIARSSLSREQIVEAVSRAWAGMPELLEDRPAAARSKRLPNNSNIGDRVVHRVVQAGRAGLSKTEIRYKATQFLTAEERERLLAALVRDGRLSTAECRVDQHGRITARYFDPALGQVRSHYGFPVFDRVMDPLPDQAPPKQPAERVSGAATEPVRSPSRGTNHKLPVPWKAESSTTSPSGATKRPSSRDSAPWKSSGSP